MKIPVAPVISFCIWQADPIHGRDESQLRGLRGLISFDAFRDIINDDTGGKGVETAGTSSTASPESWFSALYRTEDRITVAPIVPSTVKPTNMPTSQPTERPAADASNTKSPASESTQPPSLAPMTSEPTKISTTAPVTTKKQNVFAAAIPRHADIPSTRPSTTDTEISSSTGLPVKLLSYISLEVKGSSDRDTVDFICNATAIHINRVTKRSFGSKTVTTMDCDVDEPLGQVHATTRTTFSEETEAPDANEYGVYLNQIMVSDETVSTLPSEICEAALSLGHRIQYREIKAELDSSVDPPMLQLSFADFADSSSIIQSTMSTMSLIFWVLTAFVVAPW